MVRLSVNVNKIATLRNARGGEIPNVIEAARTCIDAGCHGITVHPRPDGRHIRLQDVLDLAAILTVEFNIEGFPSPEFQALVHKVGPAQVTLVPDPPGVLTSNAGWDLSGDLNWLRDPIQRMRDRGCRVSVFIDPDPVQVERAKKLGVDRIELYTEHYARTFGTAEGELVFASYRRAAVAAQELGIGLNAGHDLNLKNLPYLVEHLPGLLEVSIGHALISDALYVGLRQSVQAYLKALEKR